MERILVTGANGFVGQHVVDALQQFDCEIIGLTKSSEIDDALTQKLDTHVVCDLTKPEQVANLALQGITGVINLAGIAVNNPNESDAAKLINTNVTVHTNLYDQLLKQNVHPRVVAVSSGAVYSPDQPMPLTEHSKLATNGTAYVASKIAMEQSIMPFKAQGLDILVARPFNHTGPGQGPGFLVPDWAERLSQLEEDEEVDLSRLYSWRDILDVRDVANAQVKLLFAPAGLLTGERIYNICSGMPIQTYQVVHTLANRLGRPLPHQEFPLNESVIYGSAKKLQDETGWQQMIPFDTTIEDYADWFTGKN